jgi:hypothetical protein
MQHSVKKAKDENMSSTDSEEQIVFQGKKARQPINSLDGETEWKYRARTASDRNSSEPVDAPTGLDAQRSEGFQRFFKAVVSPTHVRVTAGGRIVPNTRNTASPTAKWDKEQPSMENQNLENDATDLPKQPASENIMNQTAQQSGPPLPHMMMPPPTPWYPCYPPMTPIYAPGPLPYYPVAHPMAMPLGMPQAPPNMTFVPHNPAFQGFPQAVHKPIESNDGSEGNEGGMASKKQRPPPIKVIPHDQFKQQMRGFPMPPMYSAPMSAGMHGQMAPLGNDGGGDSAQQAPTTHGATFNHRPSIMMPLPYHAKKTTGAVKSLSLDSPVKPTAEYNPSLFAPVKTPVTSIKPSQITKSQLSSLRATHKYYVDQLQYNKHQIDEKVIEDHVKTLRDLITEFERSYKKQVEHELHGTTVEKKEPAALGAKPGFKGYRTPPMPLEHNADQALVRSHGPNPSGLTRVKSSDQLRRKNFRDLRQRAGINSSKALDTTAALSELEKDLLEKMAKKGTPITPFCAPAIMAPIFEPRSVSQMPPIAEASHSDGSLQAQPYLVGRLPKGMNPMAGHNTAYIYPRELNENEKRARHVFWGGVSFKGSGLPKFDGKDFYPASPVVTAADVQPDSRGLATDALDLGHFPELPKKSDDPFHTGRSTLGPVPKKNTKKFSHAVPIINPNTLTRENIATTATNAAKASAPAADDLEAKSPSGGEQSASGRRTLERSRLV